MGRGGGGLQNGRGGGAREVLPLRKGGGGGGKSFSHAEGGGHKKFWASFYAVAWSFSHIEEWECKKFPLFKGGGGAWKI